MQVTFRYIFFLLFLHGCGSDQPQLSRIPDDAVILAFGDSITHGTGAGKETSYPAVLEKLSARRVINAGVPGEISERGLKRLPGLLDQHEPDLLILCHGGNDILRKRSMQQMQSNIREMINLASDRNIPVVLLGVPKFGLFLSAAPEYREIAESMNVLFIEDLLPDVLSDRDLKSDTIHPNAAGYQVMAESIHSVLKSGGVL